MKFIKLFFIQIFITISLFSADDVSIFPFFETMIAGDTKSFDVNIVDVLYLRSFEVKIQYNTNYISSDILAEGTFLDNADDNNTQLYVTGVAGSYIANCTILGPTEGTSGNGNYQ